LVGGTGTNENPGACVNSEEVALTGRAFLATDGLNCDYSFQSPIMR